MSLSFPSNPTAGQTTTQNGRTYSWSGYAWEFITQNVNSARSSLTTTSGTSNLSITGGYVPGYLDLFQNGVKLLSGSDYTATDGTSVTLANSAPSGTTIEYITLLPSINNNLYTKLDSISSSFNGSSTSFGLAVSGTAYYPVSANTLGIYVGGVRQEPISSYSVSGSNIVFTEAPSSGLTFWGVGYGTTAVATLNGIVPGSVSSPAISSSNDLSTGFYFPSSGNISIAGNLGIGTSSPSTNLDINSNKFRVRNSKTPSSATDTGNTGDICWDSNYVYVCVSANIWVRSPLSTWVVSKSPDQITGLVGWWDFGDTTTLYNATSGGSNVTADGGSVSRVNDKSGNGKNLIAGNAPVYKTGVANNRGILRFNGSSSYLSNSSFPYVNTSWSAFVVCRTTSTAAGGQHPITVFPATNSSAPNDDYMYLSLQDTTSSPANDRFGYGGTNTAATSAATRNAFIVYGLSASSGVSVLTVNGTSVATGTATDAGKSSSGIITDIPARLILNIGAFVRPANSGGILFWPGDMCEIVWYSTDISANDKASLVAWLKNKWGIT
jgi:hypothetical protein